jgi:hypothetical protein
MRWQREYKHHCVTTSYAYVYNMMTSLHGICTCDLSDSQSPACRGVALSERVQSLQRAVVTDVRCLQVQLNKGGVVVVIKQF